jgi:hypothetical protein
MDATTKRGGRFKPGVSGNPKGRPRGTGKVGAIREAMNAHVPEVIAQLIALARAGDVQAIRLLLDRTVPALRPIELPVSIAVPTDVTLAAQGQAVVAAVSAGKIAPSQAAVLLAGLGALARVKEVEELEARIAALEGLGNGES